MDMLMKQFCEFIDGADAVELRHKTESCGVTRVNVEATFQGDEFDDDGLAVNPRFVTRRLGFANRAAAEEVLAGMRGALVALKFYDERSDSDGGWSIETFCR